MKQKLLFLGMGLALAFTFPAMVLAENPPAQKGFLDNGYLVRAAGQSLPTKTSLPDVISKLVNVALSLLGLLLLAYLLYAGFLWMTSGGSEENVKKAKTMIKNAVIGLVIIAAAFAITSFVLGKLSCIAGAGKC